MKEINLTFLMMAFITIVLGTTLITQVATDTTQTTTPFTHTNDSLNIASLRYGAENINTTLNVTLPFTDWVAGSVSIRRSNGTTFVLNTDYWVDYTNERISFANTSSVVTYGSNITRAYYQYYGANYVDDAGSRAVIPLIVIMFAIGILLAVVAYLKKDAEGIF